MSLDFSAGDMTVHRIVEFTAPFLPAREMLPALTPALLDENRSWLHPHSLNDDDVFVLCYQSYLVKTPHHTILIDSCVGNDKQRPRPEWHMRSDNAFMGGLSRIGLTVNDIDFVMCSHLHLDHIGWNTRLENGKWVPTFPNARYVFGRQELAACVAAHDRIKNVSYVDSVLPILNENKAELVDDDYQIGDHIRILPTRGHTEGHYSFCLGKHVDEVVVTGDMIHVPLQMRYPELSFARDKDLQQAGTTRRWFLERYCDTATVCCTSHFPWTSVGHIKRWGTGFRLDKVDSK